MIIAVAVAGAISRSVVQRSNVPSPASNTSSARFDGAVDGAPITRDRHRRGSEVVASEPGCEPVTRRQRARVRTAVHEKRYVQRHALPAESHRGPDEGPPAGTEASSDHQRMRFSGFAGRNSTRSLPHLTSLGSIRAISASYARSTSATPSARAARLPTGRDTVAPTRRSALAARRTCAPARPVPPPFDGDPLRSVVLRCAVPPSRGLLHRRIITPASARRRRLLGLRE